MPGTNPFFTATNGYSGENSLIDSLVIEQIAMFGLDLLYMPRENINLDQLLHESTESAFELALSLPMYLKSFDGYDNSMEMLTKFGVRSSDELTLVMSKSQWTTYYAPYVKSFYNAKNGDPVSDFNDPKEGEISRRPKEGDLIYFPYDNGIFEVKYVQFDQPFYQVGKGYVFQLQCEKFEYSGETFDTGISQIDTAPIRSTFPDVEFHMEEGGVSTFKLNEKVKIYNLTDVDIATLATQNGDLLLTEDLKFIDPDNIDFFQLYVDPGFMRKTLTVNANVARWDAADRKLSLMDFSDMNPDQLNPVTGDVDINDFSTVLIIGEESGASWTSYKAQATPKAFNDAEVIQKEFNQIKILDPADTNPFGFY